VGNPVLVIVLMTLLIFPFGAMVLGEDLCPDPTLVETAGKRERHGLFRTHLRESINLGWVPSNLARNEAAQHSGPAAPV
jgi:hypothetical protein